MVKLVRYGLDKWVTRRTENWPYCQVQWVVISGTTPNQQLVTSGIPLGSIVGPILFDMFVKDLEDTLSNFTDEMKLSGAVDVLLVELLCKETWTGLRKGLEGILGRNLKKFKEAKCQVSQWRWNNLMQQYKLRKKWKKKQLCQKTPRCLDGQYIEHREQHGLAAKTNTCHSVLTGLYAGGWIKWFFLSLALVRSYLKDWVP